jgi:hypothetical protein
LKSILDGVENTLGLRFTANAERYAMNYRDAVLQELTQMWNTEGPNAFALADSLRCFKQGDPALLLAIRQLLAEERILGVASGIKTPEGAERLALALNPAKIPSPSTPMSSSVTINIGNGVTFTGPTALGHTVTQILAAASSASDPQLKEGLERLTGLVAQLAEALTDERQKTEVLEQVSVLVDQATKSQRSKLLLTASAGGLIEAAKTVAALAEPVTSPP